MEKIKDVREMFTEIVTDNIEQIKKDLHELEPKDRIKFLIDISRFILPTLKSVENNDNLRIEQPLFSIQSLYKIKA